MIGPISIGTPTTPMTRPMRCGPAALDRIVMPAGLIMPPPGPPKTRDPVRDSAGPGGAADRDQRRARAGGPRARGAGQEQADRDHVQALGAEAISGPARERDDRG